MTSSFLNRADRNRVERLLLRYVGTHSVNPVIDGGRGEAALAEVLFADLATAGFAPVREPVHPDGRDNIVATLPGRQGAPVVMFHAHLDTVGLSGKATANPLSSGGNVYGRGAGDTKGSLVAMVEAGRLLQAVDPEERATVVLVGGSDEEVGGTGAQALVAAHPEIEMAVVGEPTEGLMATGHKGTLRIRLRARGKAAHSAYPEIGDSAIHRLLGKLEELRALSWEPSPVLGEVTVNVGVISGGVAGNVLAPAAEATIYWRLVGRAAPARKRVASRIVVDPKLEWELIGENDAIFCRTLPGFATGPMAYSTDIPFMPSWGAPLLIGPGSIHDAHTASERVSKQELVEAVSTYRRIGAALLA